MAYEDVEVMLKGRSRKKIANNTYLDCYDIVEEGDGALIKMSLHGNVIAYFTSSVVQLFSSGWRTNTTKNRLNMALDIAAISPKMCIYQRNWEWYLPCYNPEGHAPFCDIPFFDGIKLDYKGTILR